LKPYQRLFGFGAIGSLLTAPSGYVPGFNEGDNDVVWLGGAEGVISFQGNLLRSLLV
jgi:hypothetical protein